MNKEEWKANYSAARIIHSGLVNMMCINKFSGNDVAVDAVWRAIENLGMADVIFGNKKHITYDIQTYKWAIKTNTTRY